MPPIHIYHGSAPVPPPWPRPDGTDRARFAHRLFVKSTIESFSMKRLFRYWLPPIGFCAVIFVQSSFPSPEQIQQLGLSDKLQHLLAYGFLGVLFCRAFNTVDRWRHRWGVLFLLGVAATTAYGLSDEWHQSFVPGRSSEAADVVADFAGSLFGCGLYLRYLQKRLKSGSA